MDERERRSTKRMACFADAELEGLDVSRRLQVRLADLSISGAFVDVRTVLPVGAKTRLSFTLHGRTIRTAVEVRYSMPSFGMGVRFLDISEDDQAFIAEVIRLLG